MPLVKLFREKRKQAKLKQQVSDVRALRRSASGQQVKNRSQQLQVDRAASRLGVNPGMQFSESSPARRRGGGSKKGGGGFR